MTKKWRDDLVHHWFEDNYLAEAFKEIKDREFETDCRRFLNQLNERLGNERRVYSFPCISAFADMNEVKKPSDEKLEEFWIDFNAGSQSVTFYVDSSEGALWDSVRLSKEAVSSYSLKEEGGGKTVKIYMKIPAILNKNEATKIKISFSAKFEILDVLRKVLGDEKMMINVAEEEPIHAGEQARQNEAVIPESNNLQRKRNPSNSENTDSLSDIIVSQHSEQLMDTKTVTSVTMITVSQQTDLEDANPGPAKKSKTPSPKMKAKPSEKPLEEEPIEELKLKDDAWEKRNRKSSLVKQKTEARKDSYDFENSDSASHEKIAEAKGKVLGRKPSSQNQSRGRETENKTRDSSKLERRQSDYRKHLFSESNSENASTGQSEKSWILDSQKRSVPRSVDYTRKRPRVRSKLKVLPVSSASSGSDYQTKKLEVPRPRAQKETLKKKGTAKAKGDDLPAVEVADETHTELEGDPVFSASAEDYSNIEEKPTQKFPNASGKSSREEEMFKRKNSDMLAGTVLKRPKLSSWETSHLSSDTSYKPRRLFNSIEEEKETKTGQKMDEMDDMFFSKILSEDVSDSGVITAFESFTSQLKKLFWSRYKRMETCAQNALRTSEKNVSALLNQIHECRLNKLETFQKIVVEELASLEKETQVLANLEKDAVDFWNAQALKLNSFCNQQKQRIQSVDSALGETAKSFVETIQNTTYERPVEKAAENVFIVPSD
ncbi:synaptonemal complex protein 2-like isoform X1 [Dromaius novaehollandiae]